jgi:hypothetical protein
MEECKDHILAHVCTGGGPNYHVSIIHACTHIYIYLHTYREGSGAPGKVHVLRRIAKLIKEQCSDLRIYTHIYIHTYAYTYMHTYTGKAVELPAGCIYREEKQSLSKNSARTSEYIYTYIYMHTYTGKAVELLVGCMYREE